jgi:hypothetical protein
MGQRAIRKRMGFVAKFFFPSSYMEIGCNAEELGVVRSHNTIGCENIYELVKQHKFTFEDA